MLLTRSICCSVSIFIVVVLKRVWVCVRQNHRTSEPYRDLDTKIQPDLLIFGDNFRRRRGTEQNPPMVEGATPFYVRVFRVYEEDDMPHDVWTELLGAVGAPVCSAGNAGGNAKVE